MIIVTGVLIVYYTAQKPTSMLYAFIIFFFKNGVTEKRRSIVSLFSQNFKLRRLILSVENILTCF
jgi:hypothetical protein